MAVTIFSGRHLRSDVTLPIDPAALESGDIGEKRATLEMDHEEAIEYVESVLSNLEETDSVYRTYVEAEGIDEGEAERLLEMLSRIEDGNIADATTAIDTLAEDEENT